MSGRPPTSGPRHLLPDPHAGWYEELAWVTRPGAELLADAWTLRDLRTEHRRRQEHRRLVGRGRWLAQTRPDIWAGPDPGVPDWAGVVDAAVEAIANRTEVVGGEG